MKVWFLEGLYLLLFQNSFAWLAFVFLPVMLLGAAIPACAQNVQLQNATGGFVFSGSSPNFHAGFGNVNGLGIGTPGTGISVITAGVSGGALYTTKYGIAVAGAGGQNTAVMRAYVSSNFAHPTVLALEACYPSVACTSAASFTRISTNSASPTDIIPIPGVLNGTYTASLALFVSASDGSGAFTDSATITFNVFAYSSNAQTLILKNTYTLTLDSPSESVQSSIQFLLGTAPGGSAITPASDFAINFGNVNGLGIGPAAGLSTSSVSGGVLYTTPYLLEPVFSGSSTGTLEVYVSTNFAHPSQLDLMDSSAGTGPFTAISTSSTSQTIMTTSAASGSNLTRYLGLFVSNANGSTIFAGSDSATLTYTLTAP